MTLMSVLSNALRCIASAERRGKRQVLIRPSSKVVVKFLQVMQKHGYIADFEIVDDHRAGKIVINLNGRLNKCGAICPRFDCTSTDFEKWVRNILPSRQFGFNRDARSSRRIRARIALVSRSPLGSVTACRGVQFFLE